MRRFLLPLTALSFSGWSQPAQQQAQPPIVVQVQMPPTNPWIHIVELIVPGIIGAGLALFGVWLTNKHNEMTNAANREHQLQVEVAKAEIAAKYKSQDNRWDFRKDVHVNLIKAATEAQRAAVAMGRALMEYNRLADQMQTFFDTLNESNSRIHIYSNLAPLAMADDVLPLVSVIQADVSSHEGELKLDLPETITGWTERHSARYTDLVQKLQEAGRKDLSARGKSSSFRRSAIPPERRRAQKRYNAFLRPG